MPSPPAERQAGGVFKKLVQPQKDDPLKSIPKYQHSSTIPSPRVEVDIFEDVYKDGKHFAINDIKQMLSPIWRLLVLVPYVSPAVFSVIEEYLFLIPCYFLYACLKDVLIWMKLLPEKSLEERMAALVTEKDRFWLHKMYQRIKGCFERPIASVPGATISVIDRTQKGHYEYSYPGTTTHCLNLSSYNYLGFAENKGPVADAVNRCTKQYGWAMASPRIEAGTSEVLLQLERKIAQFVGKEEAIVFGMGFATNSTNLPIICGGAGTLIISDTLNHNSIVTGSRNAANYGTQIRTFKHNNVQDLESVLRKSIAEGQPRSGRAWRKIIIIVEGIYSMEGEVSKLPEIIALKKKYKAYLYVDEAHSVGALGRSGRGICEYWGVDPQDVDILMGTFTKAFGSVGGYVAGSRDFIRYLRHNSYGSIYATAMSPPCAQQALSALKVIMGEDGTNDGQQRLRRLHENSNFFRNSLRLLGFHVFGHKDSPVVPLICFGPSIGVLSEKLLKHGIAVVVVGFPVTPLQLQRARFCISSAHTREQLEEAIRLISYYGDLIGLKFAKPFLDPEKVKRLTEECKTVGSLGKAVIEAVESQ